MYVTSDPRSTMSQSSADTLPIKAPIAPSGYFNFDDSAHSDQQDGIQSWYARAQNFVVVYSQADAGSEIARTGQPDEYMVILPNAETEITVSWEGAQTKVKGHSVLFVPGGDSTISIETGGPVVCCYTSRTKDIVARCDELLPAYVPDDNVPPLVSWPDPVDGFKVRSYSLDIEPVEGRFGRIFRSTNFMVNFVYPRNGPRDRTKLSPHKHDDFQQCSLCLDGAYVHHIRWPWETDANLWRDDDHVECGAPSVAVIPVGALHTSESVGAEKNQLVDIFCPPRTDFSAQPGWVLNEEEYPEPAQD